jgi:hypothetical protein
MSSIAAPQALPCPLVSTHPGHHARAAQLGVARSPLGAPHQRYERHLQLVTATHVALAGESHHLLSRRRLRHQQLHRQHRQSSDRCQSRQLPVILGLIA